MLAAISKRYFVFQASARASSLAVVLAAAACVRTTPTDPAPPNGGASRTSTVVATAVSTAPPQREPQAEAGAESDAALDGEARPHSAPAVDGPHQLPLAPNRSVFYALPAKSAAARAGSPPWRLVGHLHGICYPPSYSAGRWMGAAVDVGALVAPTGNAHCGESENGPPSWEAPSWEELVTIMDGDLERSVAKVAAKHPGTIRRDGAVLTGFSRGAYAAPVIARMHPGRWPYLVLIEANVPLSAAGLRKAGVRAVAFLAGEVGTEIAGMRKTDAELTQAGFPSRLFVMPRVGHLYPDDMDAIMADALAFVLSHEPP